MYLRSHSHKYPPTPSHVYTQAQYLKLGSKCQVCFGPGDPTHLQYSKPWELEVACCCKMLKRDNWLSSVRHALQKRVSKVFKKRNSY
jgi:hypothetical protein